MKKYLLLTICCLATGALAGIRTYGGDPATPNGIRFRNSVEAKDVAAQSVLPPEEEIGYPSLMSPHSNPIAVDRGLVYAVNTPADTLDVIDAVTREIVARVPVGIDPVSVAIRPDGLEVWVSNHVSDSVSVIDCDRDSPTFLQVIATVQQFDRRTKATRFDEPVGIAFAGNDKAYVALSSENEIAVVDVDSREVTRRLSINSQDPRAIFIRDGLLYVIPFESNNQTQLSGGDAEDIDGELVTFDAWNHSVENNNVLSLGHVVDIVKHPRVPDRDLFVFDCETDRLVDTVDTLGTLLYGLTVDSDGRVYIAQTDARNDVNGRAGTKSHSLEDLENRAFLNRVTAVDLEIGGVTVPRFIDLEPAPPVHPQDGEALATPFAIQVSEDDSTLYVSAAGSDKLFTIDTSSGAILDRIDVGAVPRGIAIAESPADGNRHAWVHNSVENSVSLVDVSDRSDLKIVETIELEDPTHEVFKRGRIAFNSASASSTGTFSCASCHPDGHTDQLLWVLKTPVVTGGEQIMPRSTMPVRGLRDTEPYHWDGIPGDPYGGNNSEHVYTSVPPNSEVGNPESSTRHVIDGALAATMALAGHETENDEGKAGLLSRAQRDDMAKFLLNVPYPPAQRRAFTDSLSAEAVEGFRLFHILGDDDPSRTTPNVCGDCHRMPFLVSTNTPGTGMDAPTWRGAYDRWLILPQGRLNIIDFDFFERVARAGLDERSIWQFSWAGRQRFDPVWHMVLEGSTGFSGAYARQVTLNNETVEDEFTLELLEALEVSAGDGAVVLSVDASLKAEGEWSRVRLQFDGEQYMIATPAYATSGDVQHVVARRHRSEFERDELVAMAADAGFIGTFTARHGPHADYDHPQPALWTRSSLHEQSGHQVFPFVYDGKRTMSLSARHVSKDATVYVDGRRVEGSLRCEGDRLDVSLVTLPDAGMHFLQVQNPGGLFSNDFIFHVTGSEQEATDIQRKWDRDRSEPGGRLRTAVFENDQEELKKLIDEGEPLNARYDDGSILLIDAVVRGHVDILKLLVESGALVNRSNRDGNTALHVAAWACDFDSARYLIENGAMLSDENNNGRTPVQVASEPWSDDAAGFYRMIGGLVGREFDLERLREERPTMAEFLRKAVDESR